MAKERDRTRMVGETVKRRLSFQNRANRSADSLLDLDVRTGQERVKILDRRRKEGRARKNVEEEEETELMDVRAREKNWIVGKEERGEKEKRVTIGSQGCPWPVSISRDSQLDDARRRGFEWKTKRSFSIWKTFRALLRFRRRAK